MFPSKQCLAIGRSRSSGFVMSSLQGEPLPDDRAQRLAELVKAGVEHGPDGRPAFLDEACRLDPAMRAKAEVLLSHHKRAHRFIEKPAVGLMAETLFREAVPEVNEDRKSTRR